MISVELKICGLYIGDLCCCLSDKFLGVTLGVGKYNNLNTFSGV